MGITVRNETQCKEAAETVRDAYYLAPSLLNTFSSIGSFIMFIAIYFRFRFSINCHINAKILMLLNMASHLLFSFATLVNYGTLFINAITAAQNCDFLFLTSSCSALRRTFLFCTMLSTLSHFSLLIERGYASYELRYYEQLGPKLGYGLGAASVILSFVAVAFVTAVEEPSELLTNCYAFSSSAIGDRVYYMFGLQLILFFFTWTVYNFLCRYLARVSQYYEGFVNERYQAVENLTILRNLGPLVLSSSAIVTVYIVFSSTGYMLRPCFTLAHYKQLASMIFIMPHNSFVSMCLYYHLFTLRMIEKTERMDKTVNSPKNEHRSYAERLTETWDMEFKNRDSGNTSPRSAKIGF